MTSKEEIKITVISSQQLKLPNCQNIWVPHLKITNQYVNQAIVKEGYYFFITDIKVDQDIQWDPKKLKLLQQSSMVKYNRQGEIIFLAGYFYPGIKPLSEKRSDSQVPLNSFATSPLSLDRGDQKDQENQEYQDLLVLSFKNRGIPKYYQKWEQSANLYGYRFKPLSYQNDKQKLSVLVKALEKYQYHTVLIVDGDQSFFAGDPQELYQKYQEIKSLHNCDLVVAGQNNIVYRKDGKYPIDRAAEYFTALHSDTGKSQFPNSNLMIGTGHKILAYLQNTEYDNLQQWLVDGIIDQKIEAYIDQRNELFSVISHTLTSKDRHINYQDNRLTYRLSGSHPCVIYLPKASKARFDYYYHLSDCHYFSQYPYYTFVIALVIVILFALAVLIRYLNYFY